MIELSLGNGFSICLLSSFKRRPLFQFHSINSYYLHCGRYLLLNFKGNTKFRYGVMNLVQMNILEAYAILQYSVIVVAVEIESKVMKL